MGVVIFRRGTSFAYDDAWCERTWMLPSTGEVGTGRIRLPYSSTAASSTYIDPDGGSSVEIISEANCGTWRGIITEINYDNTMIEIAIAQPHILLGRRIIHWEGAQIHPLPISSIVRKVFRETLPGIPGLWCKTYPTGSNDPLMRGYQYSGQDAWSVLVEMMENSSSEIFIDADTGEITWEGAMCGDILTEPLIADGNLHDWRYRALVSSRTSEVTVKTGTHRYTTSNGTSAIAYPAQSIVTSGVSMILASSAEAELLRGSGAQVVVEGSVDVELWHLRERQIARVAFPQAGFTGEEHPCRILGRSLSEDSSRMRLILQVIDENADMQQVSPAMRSGSSRTQGARGRGSYASQQVAARRSAWFSFLKDN